MSKLPADKKADGSLWPRCPWCAGDCSEATVTLGALHDAHSGGDLHWVKRAKGGAAQECALTADCPTCGRPFAIALQEERACDTTWRFMRLLAIRTAKDLAYLEGQAEREWSAAAPAE